MKKYISKTLIGLLLVIGLGLLYLTNTGILSTGQPFIRQISADFQESDRPIAFTNVNVVPMDREQVLPSQNVIIRNGIIANIGEPSLVSVPENALVIDGQGKYLMPGLVDMHVHIEYENDMLLLVANGVTSIRNMWGNTGKKLRLGMPDQLALKHQIEQDILFGPTIFTTGPVMEGDPSFHPLADVFSSSQEALRSVTWQKAQGYDFVKVYDHLSPEVYEAILDAAQEYNLPVVGHVPLAVGLDNVLAGGQQTIEHLSGYIDPDTVEFIIPENQLDEYALKTREAGVWNCVTLSEYPKSKETAESFERFQNQPGMVYVSSGTRMISPFFYMMAAKSHTYQGSDYPQRIAALNRQMVRALHQAFAGILLGTDAAQAYHLPGFSVHEELAMLVEAGLNPYEALAAGTRNPAQAMGKLDEFGTVEIGKRADLILLQENPLSDVRNLQKRSGVMLRGRWLSEAQLESILTSLVASYKPTLAERIWPFSLVAVAIFLIARKAY